VNETKLKYERRTHLIRVRSCAYSFIPTQP